MKKTVLAVDVGNTRTAVGIIDRGAKTCLARTDVLTTDLVDDLGPAVEKLLSGQGIGMPLPCAGCSVVQPQCDVINAILKPLTTNVLWVEYQPNLPITICYENPYLLGPDRIADGLYAFHLFPSTGAIIIDAGTAIKVDVLTAEGRFEGGAILPGINLQIRSLAERTSALPLINVATTKLTYPGTSTAECIAAGVVQGAAGAVSRLVGLARQQFPKSHVVATGGAWEVLSELVDFPFTVEPNMTLIGTGLYLNS